MNEPSRVVDLLMKLVRFPSVSGSEADVVAWLADHLRKHGLSPIVSGRNLYVIVEGAPSPTLLFNTHLDVVPPGEGWSSPPFDPTVRDKALYGRGANDAKGCAAAMVCALLDLAQAPPPGRIILALTCDEETGGEGLEKLIHDLPDCDAAVIGEPTFNRPALGMRGLVSLRLTARGRGCHASRPHEGTNPIYNLARDVLQLESFQPDAVDEVLGEGTVAVTVMEGGHFNARNRVPDTAEAIVDIRTTATWDNDQAIRDLSDLIRHSDVEVRSKRIQPCRTLPSAMIAQAARAAADADWYSFRGASDLFHAHCPGIILGPGNSTSHQPDEHIPLDLLEQAVTIYAALANNYFALSGQRD